MKKKKILLLLIVGVMLLTLSGCGNQSMEYPVAGWLSIGEYVVNKLAEWFRGFDYAIIGTLGSIKCSVVNLLRSVVDINWMARGMLANFNQISRIMNFVQVFAVVAIVIQFARGVWKSYFSTADNQYAPTMMTMLRKLVVAIIAAWLIPGAMITAFITTTYVGTLSTTFINENTTTDNTQNVYRTNTLIFEEMEKDRITMSTYCSEGQIKMEGVKAKDLQSIKGYFGAQSLAGSEKFEILTPESEPTLYKKYCTWGSGITNSIGSLNGPAYPNYNPDKNAPRTVGEALQYSQGAEDALLIGAYQTREQVNNATGMTGNDLENAFGRIGGNLATLIQILILIVFLFAALFFMYATAKRLVDLMVLILMSWWYIGASVSDSPQQSSLGELGKKLLSICITQLVMTVEIVIFANMVIVDPVWNGYTLIICLAWFMVLTGTPSAVQEMITSTGTADEARGVAKGIGKGISNLLN